MTHAPLSQTGPEGRPASYSRRHMNKATESEQAMLDLQLHQCTYKLEETGSGFLTGRYECTICGVKEEAGSSSLRYSTMTIRYSTLANPSRPL
jgi:hypothetical protein